MAAEQKIAVVGAGPVGTLVAAALIQNDTPFSWIVRNPERRRQLSELTVQFPDGSHAFDMGNVSLHGAIDDLPADSRVIVAVKAQDVDGLVETLPQTSPGSVMVIGNGLRTGPWGLGLLYGGGFLNSGVLVTNRENRLTVGGLDAEPDGWLWAVDALDCEFLVCTVSSAMHELMWHKLAINCVVNPLTALLDCDNGDLLGKLHGPLAQGILAETHAVMLAVLGGSDAVLAPSELLLKIKTVLRATRYNSSSMREDLRRGRPTEIYQLNGAVAAEGARRGIPCPVNEQVVAMISLLNQRR